ncbi:hypothetical protein [Lapillicoccus sp.]|uniref:hypothetical protein n=1 Tax=Lapillicoccus sp. TaxID=1909287 RepID=UPI0025DC0A14|nr:hypothetical protein [Lapillicoccus sp.]
MSPPSVSPRARAALPAVGLTVAALAVVTQLGVRQVSDPSPWLHLRVGGLLASGGRFGLPDPFSPSAARVYVPTQWLPSVLGYELFEWLGVPALAWMRALSIIALFVTLVLVSRRRLPAWPALTVSAVVTVICLPTMTERPQALGMVLLALTVLGWWGSLEDGRPRWWLVPLAWVFASSHGLWSIGLSFGAVVCLGRLLDSAPVRRTARLAVVLGAQLAVTAATPLGPALLVTPFTVGSNGRQFVEEWQPGTIGSSTVVGVLTLVVVTAGVTLVRGDRLARSRLLVVVVSLVLTFAAIRTGAPAAVILTPVLVETLARIGVPAAQPDVQQQSGQQQSVQQPSVHPAAKPAILPLGVLLTVAAVAAAAALPLSFLRSERPLGVPTAMTAQLDRLPSGTTVLSQTDVSGWLLWAAPNVAPVVDLRAESYTPDQMHAYLQTYQARAGWQGLIDSSGTRYALVEDTSALLGALESERHWTVLGRDSGYTLVGAPT